MGKVSLAKDDKLSFDGDSLVPVKAILKWSGDIDLDLACIAETDQGITVIQALDRYFGSEDSDPYVKLDQDSRSGGVETMTINMSQAEHMKRIMVFAYIYQQGGMFNRKDFGNIGEASVTIQHPEADFVIELSDGFGTTCALFELVRENDSLRLNRLEQYIKGYHQDLDNLYNWPRLNWTAGSK